MKVSNKGLLELASHEGIVPTRYKDSVNVWTWGIGHTKAAGDPDPEKMTGISTTEEVLRVFRIDVQKYETYVNALGLQLLQHEFDALVSFVYNLGNSNLRKLVGGRKREEIAAAMLKYTIAGGKENAGLVKRRKLERDLFLNGKYSSNGLVPVYSVDKNYRPVLPKLVKISFEDTVTPVSKGLGEILLSVLKALFGKK